MIKSKVLYLRYVSRYVCAGIAYVYFISNYLTIVVVSLLHSFIEYESPE